MEKFIVPNIRLFDEFIDKNRLIHTDPRYNLGDKSHVFDVVQFEGEGTLDESYKRILLIRSGYETQAEFFWQKLSETNENYELPHSNNLSTDKIKAYDIPVSSRPLIAETKRYKSEAQNRMNNERIARSLGKMVRSFADLTGLYVEPSVLESRSAIIDFIDEDTEPIFIAPPIEYVAAEVDIDKYYAEMFDYDPSFSIPFLEAVRNR